MRVENNPVFGQVVDIWCESFNAERVNISKYLLMSQKLGVQMSQNL